MTPELKNQQIINSGHLLTSADLRRAADVIDQATADNTRAAYRKDLAYFGAWAKLTTGMDPGYPVPVDVLVKFILDHSGRMDPGIDAALVDAGIKRQPGPHSISTISRRIASISIAHRYQGIQGDDNPCRTDPVRLLLAKVRRSAVKSGWSPRKKKAATLDFLFAMVATCALGKMIDLRDRALLYFAFSSGGRRRSEVAAARVDQLTPVDDGYLFLLAHSKIDQDSIGAEKPLLGKAGAALADWIDAAGIVDGYLFRRISRGGKVAEAGIRSKTVARIVQKRASMAGLDSRLFGGHSLRSGFITEAGMQGKPMGDIMALSGHRTVAVVNGYYQAGNALNNSAAKLAG
ncbi:integrase [Desulfosarcina ovata subsp. sediminis]|uniref:Integrase n=1 Tax=Desulfosarcina ovata subsp. sediminis TaxID=885957 RepID=A0A5K7ZF84_9BACT|nr:site-specific integrase [Desulfosarcina ovata]BBO80818.1 integrase [Desulfosarcina ovata subsp. sediminis]